jgi:hypothetical protein
MIKHVVHSGWLEGKLKRPEKRKAPRVPKDLPAIRHKRVLKRIIVWTGKQKRADRMLRQLRRQQKYYERRAAA